MQMLDAFLPGVRCFPSTDHKRHMPNYRNALPPSLVNDGKVRIPGKPIVDLDEISASLLLFINESSRFLNGTDRHHIRVTGRVAVDNGTSQKNVWCVDLFCGHLDSEFIGIERTIHVT